MSQRAVTRIARSSLKDMTQPNGAGIGKSARKRKAKKAKISSGQKPPVPLESLLCYRPDSNDQVSRNRDVGGVDIYQESRSYKGQDGERIARRRSLSPPRRDTRRYDDDDRRDRRNPQEDPRMWQQQDNFDDLNNMPPTNSMQIIEQQQQQNPMLIQMPLSALNMGSSLNPNQTYILYQDQAAALSALGGNQANVQFIPVTANMMGSGGGGGGNNGLQSLDTSPSSNYLPRSSQRDLAGKNYDSIQDRADYHQQKSSIVDQRKPSVVRYDGVNLVGEDAIIRVPYCRVCNEYIPRDKDLEIHLRSQQHFQNYYSGNSNLRDDDIHHHTDRKLPSNTITTSSSTNNRKDSYYNSPSSSREVLLEEKRSTLGRQRDEDYYADVGRTRRSSPSRHRSRSPLPSSHSHLASSSRSSHHQQQQKQQHYIEDERTRQSDIRDRGHGGSSSIDRHNRSNRDEDSATLQRLESFSEYLRGRDLQPTSHSLQNISSSSRSHHQDVEDHHRRDSRDRDSYRRDTTTEFSDSRRYRDEGVDKIYRRHQSPIPTSSSALGTSRSLQPLLSSSSPILRSRALDPDMTNKYPKFNAPKTLSKDFGKTGNRRKDFGQPFSTDDARIDSQTYGKISQCTVCGLKGQFNLRQHMAIAHKV